MITRPHVKINLGLHVLRRRADGYHDLETLFVPFHGICDTLEIVPGDGFLTHFPAEGDVQAVTPDGKVLITIRRSGGVDWNPAGDLTVKAYRLLDEEFHLPPVKIFLEKTSPVGAGLGGGSADAAFALRMISDLFSLGLSDEALSGYAARLGSDCAFFVYDAPMMGTGRGEVLSPWSGWTAGADDRWDIGGRTCRLEVVVPRDIAVSTAQAYRGIVPRAKRPALRDLLREPISRWKDLVVNDFETTVFAVHPDLARYKQTLYDRGAVYAAMSGSGSALFGLFPV